MIKDLINVIKLIDIRPYFDRYDWRIGMYLDTSRQTIDIQPLPMVGIEVDFSLVAVDGWTYYEEDEEGETDEWSDEDEEYGKRDLGV